MKRFIFFNSSILKPNHVCEQRIGMRRWDYEIAQASSMALPVITHTHQHALRGET